MMQQQTIMVGSGEQRRVVMHFDSGLALVAEPLAGRWELFWYRWGERLWICAWWAGSWAKN